MKYIESLVFTLVVGSVLLLVSFVILYRLGFVAPLSVLVPAIAL